MNLLTTGVTRLTGATTVSVSIIETTEGYAGREKSMAEIESSKDRQRQILWFIVDYKKDHNGIPPTVRQIAKKIGTTSTSVAFHHLKKLVEKGFLVRRCGHYDVTWGRWSMEE